MAGHLPVEINEQKELISDLWKFLDENPIKKMNLFERYKSNGLTFQRLSDEYFMDENDKHVISVYPVTFEVFGETQEGAIAEIHLDESLKINQIYMVM